MNFYNARSLKQHGWTYHSTHDTLSRFRSNRQISISVFDLTRLGLETMSYCIRDKHANKEVSFMRWARLYSVRKIIFLHLSLFVIYYVLFLVHVFLRTSPLVVKLHIIWKPDTNSRRKVFFCIPVSFHLTTLQKHITSWQLTLTCIHWMSGTSILPHWTWIFPIVRQLFVKLHLSCVRTSTSGISKYLRIAFFTSSSKPASSTSYNIKYHIKVLLSVL